MSRIEELIDSGTFAPSTPLPPEQVLADRFSVNRLTLRKAIGALVDEGIVVRRPGSGTFVLPPEARGVHKASVLYVGSTTDHFFQAFYEALCADASRRGKGVTAFTPTSNEETQRQLGRLARSHSRVICMERWWDLIQPVISDDVQVTRILGAESDTINRDRARPGFMVGPDIYRAVKLAVEHLADHGHKCIGYVDAGSDILDDPMAGIVPIDRPQYLGFHSGLRERKSVESCVLAIPHKLVRTPGVDFMASHERFFEHHLNRLKEWPTAFVCVNDFRAGPLIRVLRHLGRRVPHDISVVGIGNTPWSEALEPSLTSVCLGETEMARMAMLLNEEPPPDSFRLVRVDPELIERQSVGQA